MKIGDSVSHTDDSNGLTTTGDIIQIATDDNGNPTKVYIAADGDVVHCLPYGEVSPA